MKLFLLIIITYLSTQINAFSQTVLDPSWVKTETSPVDAIAEGWGVDTDDSGAIYWPINVNTNNQGLDIVCYKFNPDGTPLWANPLFFGGPGAQQSYVANAQSNELYIGGRYCEITGFSCDMQLLKVDKTSGTILWDKTFDFGNNGYDEIDGLEIEGNDIYCGGWAQALQEGPYQTEIGLWKVTSDGETDWSNFLGESETAEHQDGHFVVDDQYIFASGLWNGTGAFNLYNGHAFLGKFSKNDGTLIDSTLFGNQANTPLDIENALGMTTDGTFLYITGYTTPTTFNNWQIFIAKFDKDLNQIWYRDWGGSNTETARAIVVKDDKVFVAGLTQSPEIVQGGGNGDAVLVVYDTDGNFIEYQTWGGTIDETFRDMAIHNNNIYLSGSSGEDLFLPNNSSDTAFLLKVESDLLTTDDFNIQHQEILVYPNPVKNSMTVRIGDFNSNDFVFYLYDTKGALLKKTILQSPEQRILVDQFANGMYFYEIKSQNKSIDQGKIIIE